MTHHRMGESPSLVKAYNVCKSPNFQCLWKHQGNVLCGKPCVTNSAYEQHNSGNAHGCRQQQYVCKLEHYITRCLLEGGCFPEVWNMDEQLDAEGKSIQAESILQDRQQVFVVGRCSCQYCTPDRCTQRQPLPSVCIYSSPCTSNTTAQCLQRSYTISLIDNTKPIVAECLTADCIPTNKM